MFWVRSLLVGSALLFCAAGARAQVGCTPNPNLTPLSNNPPGYVNGCGVPAAALSNFSPLSVSPGGAIAGPKAPQIGIAYGLNYFATADTGNAINNQLSSVLVNQQINSGAGEASRSAIYGILQQNATVPRTSTHFYTAVGALTNVVSGDGGGSGTEAGNYYAFGGLAEAFNGATFLFGLKGGEIDSSINTGASVKYHQTLTIDLVNSHAVRGYTQDNALSFGADNTTTQTWKNGIVWADQQAAIFPWGTDTVLQTGGRNGTITTYLDLSGWTFNGNIINFPKWSLLNTGTTVTTAAFATPWQANDSNATVTTGGLVRFGAASAGIYCYQINTAGAGNFTTANQATCWHADGGMVPLQVAVASLPTCNAAAKGEIFEVTDANAPTYGATLSGSGSVVALAICDGVSAWKAH